MDRLQTIHVIEVTGSGEVNDKLPSGAPTQETGHKQMTRVKVHLIVSNHLNMSYCLHVLLQ